MNNTIEKLIKIAGEGAVQFSEDAILPHIGNRNFETPMRPMAIVRPQSGEQVEAIVNYAKENGVPLVPVSSGGPHYSSSSAPSVPGAVIVDLSGMKKIISINRRFCMAVIEPGVTYGQLQKALADEGLTISVPLAPKINKSVIASLLEVQPRLNSVYQWNYIDPLRCMEVTWGDGNRMYTGEAGGGVRDLNKQQAQGKWQINGAGPMMLDFCRLLTGSQGTMGIVTWASVKCEQLPQIHNIHTVESPSIKKLCDFTFEVLRWRFSDELMIMNAAYLSTVLAEDVISKEKIRKQLNDWQAIVGIAGKEMLPELRVKQLESDISDIAKKLGLNLSPQRKEIEGADVLGRITSACVGTHWRESYSEEFAQIFFVTTISKTEFFVNAMNELAKNAGYPVKEIGVYIQPQHAGTSCHCEFLLPYHADNLAQVRELFFKASAIFSEMGAYFARPYGIWAKLQFEKDPLAAKHLKTVKKIFDPKMIMNPRKLSTATVEVAK